MVCVIWFGFGKKVFFSVGVKGIGVCGYVIFLMGVFRDENFFFVMIEEILFVKLYWGGFLFMMINCLVFLIDFKIIFLFSGDVVCGFIML